MAAVVSVVDMADFSEIKVSLKEEKVSWLDENLTKSTLPAVISLAAPEV